MARVGLDPDGRLISLLVVPGERTEPGSAAAEPDWEPLLRATGVDAKTLEPVAPEWAPPVFADRRAAWTGSWPGKPDVPLRIEAAAASGRPVSLRIVQPWTRPAEAPIRRQDVWKAWRLMLAVVFPLVIVGAGSWRCATSAGGGETAAARFDWPSTRRPFGCCGTSARTT